MEGFTFDYGPHVILSVPELFGRLNLVLEDCACESTIFPNLARVVSIPAPIQHHLYRLPLSEKVRIFSDIVRRNLNGSNQPADTFERLMLTP